MIRMPVVDQRADDQVHAVDHVGNSRPHKLEMASNSAVGSLEKVNRDTFQAAQCCEGCAKFAAAYLSEVLLRTCQLAVGDDEHHHWHRGLRRGGDQAAASECLVVGMGTDNNQATERLQGEWSEARRDLGPIPPRVGPSTVTWLVGTNSFATRTVLHPQLRPR